MTPYELREIVAAASEKCGTPQELRRGAWRSWPRYPVAITALLSFHCGFNRFHPGVGHAAIDSYYPRSERHGGQGVHPWYAGHGRHGRRTNWRGAKRR